MKILVVGGGGREHAIVKKLKENQSVTELYCLPGNGGIAQDAVCVPIAATDLDGIVAFAMEHKIDYAVVAPDDPLALGAVDRLEAIGVDCFGPRKNAAVIEASKVFAKELMQRYGIPTARYKSFERMDEALAYLQSAPMPTVIKADGLALGKGVVIAQTRAEAEQAVRAMMEEQRFGKSGARIVIEEFLEGPEVSVLSFTDGKTVVPMVSSMDHKRAGEGDTGLNTGGMGSVSPVSFADKAFMKKVEDRIVKPTVRGLRDEKIPYCGFIFIGLMCCGIGTDNAEPYVIEYNVRMGDPETESVFPRIKSDMVNLFENAAHGDLDGCKLEVDPRTAACVMMVAKGYPESYPKGDIISLGQEADGVTVFHCGTKRDNEGHLVTAGGRVICATALSNSLPEALLKSYNRCQDINWEGKYQRRDIGQDLLKLMQEG